MDKAAEGSVNDGICRYLAGGGIERGLEVAEEVFVRKGGRWFRFLLWVLLM